MNCLSLLKLIAANDLHKFLESSCYVVSIRKLLVDRFDLLGFEETERLYDLLRDHSDSYDKPFDVL